MVGWPDCEKWRKKQTPKAQRPTPINREQATNYQQLLLKTPWMTISTFPLRWVFCSNRFVKPIAPWIKTKWTRLRQVHGSTVGNESTLFLISKLRLTSPFQTKWRTSQKSARTLDGKKIGNAATNYGSRSPRSAGKSVTPKAGRNSPGPSEAHESCLFISLRTCTQIDRSPQQTACARVREARHRNILNNARGLSGCIAADSVAKRQSLHTQRENRRQDFRNA